MPRSIPFLAGAWLLALAGPAFAADPDTTPTNTSTAGGLTVRAIRVGDEEVTLGKIPVGIAACNADAEIEFQIDGVPDERKSVDVYLGESCNATSSRDDTTTSRCEYIGNFEAGSSRGLVILLHAKQLLGDDCTEERDDTPKLWFLAVTVGGGPEDVGTYYGMLDSLSLDTRAPNAPTNVEGGSGEKQIPVEWDTSDSDLEGFVVLIDTQPTDGSGGGAGTTGSSGTSGGNDDDGGMESPSATAGDAGGAASSGECGSSVLRPGGSASGLPGQVRRKEVNEGTATGIDLGPGDIDGDFATIAVIAIDEAGNESPISTLACVKVVPTESFWDRYQEDGDAVDGGCPCAAIGPAQLQSAWPVGLSLSLIALSARRRRRS